MYSCQCIGMVFSLVQNTTRTVGNQHNIYKLIRVVICIIMCSGQENSLEVQQKLDKQPIGWQTQCLHYYVLATVGPNAKVFGLHSQKHYKVLHKEFQFCNYIYAVSEVKQLPLWNMAPYRFMNGNVSSPRQLVTDDKFIQVTSIDFSNECLKISCICS